MGMLLRRHEEARNAAKAKELDELRAQNAREANEAQALEEKRLAEEAEAAAKAKEPEEKPVLQPGHAQHGHHHKRK